MASNFTWQQLENRVLKTRRKNPEKIKSTQAAANLRPREPGYLGRASPRSRAAWVARPRARQARAAWVVRPGARATQAAKLRRPGFRRGVWFFLGFFFVFIFFFFFSFWHWFQFCWYCCFVIYRLINRVFKTRFSSSRHVEYDVTSDVNRPWKSSIKDSIYRSKSSLLYSNC